VSGHFAGDGSKVVLVALWLSSVLRPAGSVLSSLRACCCAYACVHGLYCAVVRSAVSALLPDMLGCSTALLLMTLITSKHLAGPAAVCMC
jgi:hypothetical protein